MFIVQQITDDPLQTQTLVLPDGSFVNITMYFIPMQFGWFLTSLSYNNFVLNGLRICVSPNMLHQFKNQIPFGMACLTQTGREPSQLQDFSSGAFQLYILTQAEVEEFAEIVGG